jgi:hypothetical protein
MDTESGQPTAFTEANALLVVQQDDYETAREILADSHDSELHALADAATELARLCEGMLRERRSRLPLEPRAVAVLQTAARRTGR